jgi:Fic family protein
MLGVSRNGHWTDWLIFFLEMTLLSCRSAIDTARSLIAIRNQFRAQITGVGGSARFTALSDHLFVRPVISIPDAAAVMDVSYPAAQNAVRRLVELAILREFDSPIRPKLFVCDRVIKAIES